MSRWTGLRPAFLSITIVCICLLAPPPALAQSVVGIGGSGFFEDSDLDGERQASVQVEDESFEYVADDFLTATIWFLYPLSERIRVGSTLEYYGEYAAEIVPEEELDEDEEPDVFEFGKLLEFYARFEYMIPASESVDVMFGAVLGVPILFPDDDLEDQIDELDEQGVGVFDLPRVGYLVGPVISGLWAYSDYLSLRSDIMVKWEQIFLFRTSEEVDGTPFRKEWTTSTVRYHLNFGLEISL